MKRAGSKNKKQKQQPELPLKPGTWLALRGEKKYRVVECYSIGGKWYVKLWGVYGNFETTLDRIEESGYVKVDRSWSRKKGARKKGPVME